MCTVDEALADPRFGRCVRAVARHVPSLPLQFLGPVVAVVLAELDHEPGPATPVAIAAA